MGLPAKLIKPRQRQLIAALVAAVRAQSRVSPTDVEFERVQQEFARAQHQLATMIGRLNSKIERQHQATCRLDVATDTKACDVLAAALSRDMLGTTWFYFKHLEVCMRLGYHHVNDVTTRTLDIVNIQVHEKSRGRGALTSFVRWLETHPAHKQFPIYVENVLDSSHNAMWEHLGFTQLPGRDYNTCFLKPSSK